MSDILGFLMQKREDELKQLRIDFDTLTAELEELRPMTNSTIKVLRVPEYTDYDCQEIRIIENGHIQESIHVRFHAALLITLLEEAGAVKGEFKSKEFIGYVPSMLPTFFDDGPPTDCGEFWLLPIPKHTL